MKLRVARHTDQLPAIRKFYIKTLGLKLIGEIDNHNNYSAIFCQSETLGWHLEFTSSSEKANHSFDEDDMMVFYLNDQKRYDELLQNLRKENTPEITARNPWWNEHGHTFLDPDGCRIVICLQSSS